MRDPISKPPAAEKPDASREDLLDAVLWLSENYGFPSPSRAAHEARRRVHATAAPAR